MLYFPQKSRGAHNLKRVFVNESFERLNAIWGFEVTKCDVKNEIAKISNRKNIIYKYIYHKK